MKQKEHSFIRVIVFVIIVIMLVVFLWSVYKAYTVPNFEFVACVSGVGTFLTAVLTALYVYTTTQQISIANKQLSEMKFERLSQEQPLVLVDSDTFTVHSPKMYFSPPENEYSFNSQFVYEGELKNESSFSAVSVDVSSEMLISTKKGIRTLKSASNRIKVLPAGQKTTFDFLFLGKGDISIYDSLRQLQSEKLPIIKTTIVYRNLCGGFYSSENYSMVFPTMEEVKDLVAWQTAITSAEVASRETVEYLLSLNESDPNRDKLFHEIKEAFDNSTKKPSEIQLECVDQPLKFDIRAISKDEYEECVQQHGYSRRVRGHKDCLV